MPRNAVEARRNLKIAHKPRAHEVYTTAALCPGIQTVIQRRKQHSTLLTRDFSSPRMQPLTQPALLWGCETGRLMHRSQPIIIVQRLKEHELRSQHVHLVARVCVAVYTTVAAQDPTRKRKATFSRTTVEGKSNFRV